MKSSRALPEPRLRGLVPAALIALAVATPALADEAIILRNDEVLGGKVLSIDADFVVMELRRGGQAQEVKVRLADIKPGSLYTLKAARIPDGDAAAHLALGDWCLAHDLGYFARREYAKAKQLDATLAQKADEGIRKADLARGRHFYTKAVEAMQKRDFAEAKRLFELVVKRYPKPFGGPAQKALQFVDAQLAQARAAGQQGQQAQQPGGQQQGAGAGQGQGQGGQQGGGGPAPSPLDARVQARLTHIGRQVGHITERGYFAKTDSRARRAWEDAYELVGQALAILARERQRGAIDDDAYARLRRPFIRQGADLGLQLAVIALRRDNEYAAQRWLARVLLLDPNNERAKELRIYVVTEFRDRNRRRPGKPYLR